MNKRPVFINISNHPFSEWQTDQQDAAHRVGTVYDILFPVVPSEWDTQEVAMLVDVYRGKIKELLPKPDGVSVVHVMGESVFTFMLVSLLLSEKYIVVASTTERVVSYEGDKKISSFKFVRFRKYHIDNSSPL